MSVRIEPEVCRKLGLAIKRRRLARGLSQEKLAERADCHRNQVGFVERGEVSVSFSTLYRLAQALETTIASLSRSAKV